MDILENYLYKIEKIKYNLLTNNTDEYIQYRKKYELEKYLYICLSPELICLITNYEGFSNLDSAAIIIYFSKEFNKLKIEFFH
jgi:hypothetical protein